MLPLEHLLVKQKVSATTLLHYLLTRLKKNLQIHGMFQVKGDEPRKVRARKKVGYRDTTYYVKNE